MNICPHCNTEHESEIVSPAKDELVDKHISTVSKLGMVKGKYKFMDTKAESKDMGGIDKDDEEMIDYVYDSHIVVRGEDLTDYV